MNRRNLRDLTVKALGACNVSDKDGPWKFNDGIKSVLMVAKTLFCLAPRLGHDNDNGGWPSASLFGWLIGFWTECKGLHSGSCLRGQLIRLDLVTKGDFQPDGSADQPVAGVRQPAANPKADIK
eukprot:1140993-Pelagomonas_calceolata.AAC.1